MSFSLPCLGRLSILFDERKGGSCRWVQVWELVSECGCRSDLVPVLQKGVPLVSEQQTAQLGYGLGSGFPPAHSRSFEPLGNDLLARTLHRPASHLQTQPLIPGIVHSLLVVVEVASRLPRFLSRSLTTGGDFLQGAKECLGLVVPQLLLSRLYPV